MLLHRMFVLGDLQDDDDGGGGGLEGNDDRTLRQPAALSRHRREAWTRYAAAAGPWLSDRYGDAVVAVACRGHRDRRGLMRESVAACVRSLREYGARAAAGLPCRVAGLPVPQRELRAKAGACLDACPACLVDGGPRPDRSPAAAAVGAVVQYRRHLYRVCPRHGDAFAGDARRYADAVAERPDAATTRPGAVAEWPDVVAEWPGVVAAVRDLPTLGYLEQTVGAHVGRALTLLAAARPAYPGLSAEVAAAVFVGLRVGAYGSDGRVNRHYRRAFRRFADACRRYKSLVAGLQSAASP